MEMQMDTEMEMDATDTYHWSDAPTVLDFERLLDFGVVAGTDNPSSKATTKPLACARCHGQKLRCVRSKTSDGRVCDRCAAARVDCVDRQPQRIGRPADVTMRPSRRASKTHAHDYVSAHLSTTRRRPRSALTQTSSTKPSPTNMTTDNNKNSSPILFEVDGWTWPSPSEIQNQMLPAPPPAASEVAQGASDSPSSTPAQASSTGLTSYDGSLGSLGPVESPSHLLPSLEDLGSLFPFGIDVSCLNSQQSPEMGDEAPVDDPVEHLSRLQLELYRCLVTVKSVEKMKKEKLRRSPEEPSRDIDTSWSENLFRTTERFIEALRAYVGTEDLTTTGVNPSPAVSTSEQGTETDNSSTSSSRGPGSHVDTATGLLIVSCYTRLLQIFDVVVFVVETFKEMNCPGRYVQVSFGSFAPAANRSLQARILGQYVLHLLEGLSEVADKATASRQPYARAVAEARRIEAKLKERICTVLQ